MARPNRAPRELVPLIDQLEAVRFDQCGRPLGVLPEIRAVLGLEAVVYARVIEKTHGWALEGFEADGLRNPTRFRRMLTAFLEGQGGPGPWLDLARPAPAQCNVAFCVDDQAAYQRSTFCETVMKPLDLHMHHFVRVLLCEDGVTRGWLGGFSLDPIRPAQRTQLEALVAPLLSRMRMERLLGAAPRVHAALDATLQQIGAPALLVDARGRVHEMNRAARDLLLTQKTEVNASIAAVLANREPALPFTLTPISVPGGQEQQYLAILRPRSDEERLTLAVTLAGFRWTLTARQAVVLGLVVKGDTNAEIARQLEVSDRAAELHVSALFERAKVTNRAQLVAAVLLL